MIGGGLGIYSSPWLLYHLTLTHLKKKYVQIWSILYSQVTFKEPLTLKDFKRWNYTGGGISIGIDINLVYSHYPSKKNVDAFFRLMGIKLI